MTYIYTQCLSIYLCIYMYILDLPDGSGDQKSACNAGDTGSTTGSWKPPGGGNGNPLQYSCLWNHMDRGAWWTTVHEVARSQTWLRD